jgi:fatty acid elongase 3
MQITQFVIDLFVVYFGSTSRARVLTPSRSRVRTAYSYFSATYWPHWPSFGSCAGTEGAALFGCGLLTSYLFLFIKFYIDTYRTKPSKAKKQPLTNGAAHANGNGCVHISCSLAGADPTRAGSRRIR